MIESNPIARFSQIGPWCRRPERVPQAGLFLTVVGACYTAWCLFSFAIVLTGLWQVERVGEACVYGALALVLIDLPMLFLGLAILKTGHPLPIWGGAVLSAAVFVVSVGGDVLGYNPGGMYTDQATRLHMFVLLCMVFLAQFGLLCVALYSHRCNSRGSPPEGHGIPAQVDEPT